MYALDWRTSAQRDYDKLERSNAPVLRRTSAAILDLRQDPRPPGCIKIGENAWRIRVGTYRVVYGIDDSTKTVTLYRIKSRPKAYRK